MSRTKHVAALTLALLAAAGVVVVEAAAQQPAGSNGSVIPASRSVPTAQPRVEAGAQTPCRRPGQLHPRQGLHGHAG